MAIAASEVEAISNHQVVRSDLRYHHPERIRRSSRLSKLQHRWDLYEVPQASRLGTRMLRSVCYQPPRLLRSVASEVLPTKARRLFEDGARASRRARADRAVPCSGRRGNRASEVEVGLLGLPRQNIEPSSLQEKLHVDLTGQGSRGKRHRGKAESPETY